MSSIFTREEITKIIKSWAKDKAEQNEMVFDESFCGGYYVRYKTDTMTKWIPDNSEGKLGGWKRPDHYAYEIECRSTILNLMLTFTYTNISDETKRVCDELLKKYMMMPKMDTTDSDDNFFRLCIYDINIDNLSAKGIWLAIDKLFYQMKGYEEFICYKMDEEKKKKNID